MYSLIPSIMETNLVKNTAACICHLDASQNSQNCCHHRYNVGRKFCHFINTALKIVIIYQIFNVVNMLHNAFLYCQYHATLADHYF